MGINSLKESKNQLFQYGFSEDQNINYLRIKRFYGAPFEDINSSLDTIFSKIKSGKNIIIDIRTNPGGNDETALLCAGYLYNSQQIAFTKQMKIPHTEDKYSPLDTTYVNPRGTLLPKFENIYLLINGATGSSAEIFALALSYLPNVVKVGTNTEGIFSNMYRDTLSNNWTITLSNQKYYSKEGVCFEKIGIPADLIARSTFLDSKKGIDNHIEVLKTHLFRKS